jgi:hypothetical protein
VHHEIGLHRPHPLTDRGTEFRGPRHPVPRRKHRAKSRVESRSQLAATLAAPVRHDRSACPGAHPQPEPMHPRPTAVVGLKGPLALGHGCSLLVAFGIRKPTPMNPHAGGDAIAVGKLVRLANRRGLQRILGRSRIATCGRLFEGTDENSLGQTSPDGAPRVAEWFTNTTAVTQFQRPQLKPRTMLQNGWHPPRKLLASANAVSITERRQTTKRGCPQRREPTVNTTTVTSPGLRRHRP